MDRKEEWVKFDEVEESGDLLEGMEVKGKPFSDKPIKIYSVWNLEGFR